MENGPERQPMNTKKYILHKYNIKTDVIEIPNTGRTDLAELFHELDFKLGLEVGVAAGEYSHIIMKFNPQLELMYGVDPYEPYKGYKDYARLGTFNSLHEAAHRRLDSYPNYQFLKLYSLDAAKRFENESLDFVYIDGNHSDPYITQDITAWAPKVRKGGIVAGHDYARIKQKGVEDSTNWAVIPAVDKYVRDNNYQLFIWGLEAKIPGLKRDGSRSWMFIK
jgi:hypothetical protein